MSGGFPHWRDGRFHCQAQAKAKASALKSKDAARRVLMRVNSDHKPSTAAAMELSTLRGRKERHHSPRHQEGEEGVGGISVDSPVVHRRKPASQAKRRRPDRAKNKLVHKMVPSFSRRIAVRKCSATVSRVSSTVVGGTPRRKSREPDWKIPSPCKSFPAATPHAAVPTRRRANFRLRVSHERTMT